MTPSAKLGHPSVVRVYDKVMVGGLQGFTMQRAGELTLAQRLSKEGRLSLELLERFGEQLLEAVNYLDQEGVSHRDVKPENLGIGSHRRRWQAAACSLRLLLSPDASGQHPGGHAAVSRTLPLAAATATLGHPRGTLCGRRHALPDGHWPASGLGR